MARCFPFAFSLSMIKIVVFECGKSDGAMWIVAVETRASVGRQVLFHSLFRARFAVAAVIYLS